MLVVEVDEMGAVCVVVGPRSNVGNPVCTLEQLRASSKWTGDIQITLLVPNLLSASDEDVLCRYVFKLSTSQVLECIDDSPAVVRFRHAS